MSFSEFEDIGIAELQNFIENGKVSGIPPEIAKKLTLMEMVRSLYSDQHKTEDYIIKLLQFAPYNLSRYKADKLFSDTLNFHFAQKDIKQEAILNLYAEKYDKLALLAIEVNDFVGAGKLYKMAEENRAKAAQKKQIPDDIFEKRPTLYVIDPRLLGRRKTNTKLLGEYIDKLEITEAEKNRLHRDGMTTDKIDFFADVEEADIEFLEKNPDTGE
ncbi:MAG: hypothetical protein NTZ33_14430 [Bacteroidetes bacterium]|nr:hypothetical protein [Bacteroidota bacterium]